MAPAADNHHGVDGGVDDRAVARLGVPGGPGGVQDFGARPGQHPPQPVHFEHRPRPRAGDRRQLGQRAARLGQRVHGAGDAPGHGPAQHQRDQAQQPGEAAGHPKRALDRGIDIGRRDADEHGPAGPTGGVEGAGHFVAVQAGAPGDAC